MRYLLLLGLCIFFIHQSVVAKVEKEDADDDDDDDKKPKTPVNNVLCL